MSNDLEPEPNDFVDGLIWAVLIMAILITAIVSYVEWQRIPGMLEGSNVTKEGTRR